MKVSRFFKDSFPPAKRGSAALSSARTRHSLSANRLLKEIENFTNALCSFIYITLTLTSVIDVILVSFVRVLFELLMKADSIGRLRGVDLPLLQLQVNVIRFKFIFRV